MGWLGFNCSIPHKVAVKAYLDELAPSASLIGAVNCVVIRDGRLSGENTDGKGFLASLKTVVDPQGRKVLLFGAGGAARAIAVETALAGAEAITIVNREREKGEELAAHIARETATKTNFQLWNETVSIPADIDIVVNATSIGLYPDVEGRLNVNLDSLRPETVVADVIPNPPRTSLIRDAEARGCRALDGLGMLVNQGITSIRLWTGIDVDAEPMRQCLRDIFSH